MKSMFLGQRYHLHVLVSCKDWMLWLAARTWLVTKHQAGTQATGQMGVSFPDSLCKHGTLSQMTPDRRC